MASDPKTTEARASRGPKLNVPLTSYDKFVLRNRGLVPGTPAYSVAAQRMKGLQGSNLSVEESKEQAAQVEDAENTGYSKMGIAGMPLERNTRIAQVLATMPGYSDMAQAILASVSPLRSIGGPRQ